MTATPPEPLVRTVSVRISHRTWRRLEAAARVRQITVSDICRAVFDSHWSAVIGGTRGTERRPDAPR